MSQDMDDVTLVPSSAESDDTIMDDTEGTEKVTVIDLTMDEEGALGTLPPVDAFSDDENSDEDHKMEGPKAEERVTWAAHEPDFLENEDHTEEHNAIPESEKTAENGWIVILQNPKIPYDQEEDPAGLYGGKEVDDRPSLWEFYHQDARTNGNFAKMAPTKAELAAAAAVETAAKLAAEQKEASKAKKPTLVLRPPKGDASLLPKRTYANALTRRSRVPAPLKRFPNASQPHSIAAERLKSAGNKEMSSTEKVMNIFDQWQGADKPKAKGDEDPDYQKAIQASLTDAALAQRRKEEAEWPEGLWEYKDDISTPIFRVKPQRNWVPHSHDKSKRYLQITNFTPEEENFAKQQKEIDSLLAKQKEFTKKEVKLKENMDPDLLIALEASEAAEIEENADFHNSMDIPMPTTGKWATGDQAAIEQEEAEIQKAIDMSLKEANDKKRKSIDQSPKSDGSIDRPGTEMVGNEAMTPKEGKRNHKRCKRFPHSE